MSKDEAALRLGLTPPRHRERPLSRTSSSARRHEIADAGGAHRGCRGAPRRLHGEGCRSAGRDADGPVPIRELKEELLLHMADAAPPGPSWEGTTRAVRGASAWSPGVATPWRS